jgi:hypothetical protein
MSRIIGLYDWTCVIPLYSLKIELLSWSQKQVGSIKLQPAVANQVVFKLDQAQESTNLSNEEVELWKELKLKSLGLASLHRTMVRQHSIILFLAEGDVNTKFFTSRCHY